VNSTTAAHGSVSVGPNIPVIADRGRHSPCGYSNDSREMLGCTGEATFVVHAPGGNQFDGAAHTDPLMAMVFVVLVALGVVGMALYVLQLAIKAKER
jgi:hypothetical protein